MTNLSTWLPYHQTQWQHYLVAQILTLKEQRDTIVYNQSSNKQAAEFN